MPATPALLEDLTGAVTRDASFANADVWVSTHSANPGSTGAHELTSGTGAAGRQQATFNSGGAGSDPSNNTVTVTVPTTQTITWYGLWSAQTGGTFLGSIPACVGPQLVAIGLNASPTITSPNHGLAAGDAVRLFVAPNAQSGIPVGLGGDPNVYFVVPTVTVDTLELSDSFGGSPITPSSSAAFLMQADATQVFTGAGMLVINAGNLVYGTVS